MRENVATQEYLGTSSMQLDMIMHEMKSPLAILNTAYHLLEQNSEHLNYEKIKKIIQDSLSRIHRCYDFFQEVMVQKNHREVSLKKINIYQFVHQLAEQQQLLVKNKKFTIEDELENHDIIVNPYVLDHIFVNLIMNAFKFAKKEVKIILTVLNKKIILKVLDDGMGIPSQEIQKIFLPYYKLENGNQHVLASGAGLGLAIVKMLCDYANIKLQVSTVPGLGTEFSLIL